MNAEILSVGTELLLGHVVNTDTAYVARALSSIGINVHYTATVGDNPQRLQRAVEESLWAGSHRGRFDQGDRGPGGRGATCHE